MIKKISIIFLIIYSYFTFGKELIVTPKMIKFGRIEVRPKFLSRAVTKITFADGNYNALKEIFVYNNSELKTLTIPADLPALKRICIYTNPKLTAITIPSGLTTLKSIHLCDNPNLTSLVMDNPTVERSYDLAFIIPRTPKNLAAAARVAAYHCLLFQTENVTVIDGAHEEIVQIESH